MATWRALVFPWQRVRVSGPSMVADAAGRGPSCWSVTARRSGRLTWCWRGSARCPTGSWSSGRSGARTAAGGWRRTTPPRPATARRTASPTSPARRRLAAAAGAPGLALLPRRFAADPAVSATPGGFDGADGRRRGRPRPRITPRAASRRSTLLVRAAAVVVGYFGGARRNVSPTAERRAHQVARSPLPTFVAAIRPPTCRSAPRVIAPAVAEGRGAVRQHRVRPDRVGPAAAPAHGRARHRRGPARARSTSTRRPGHARERALPTGVRDRHRDRGRRHAYASAGQVPAATR